MPQVRALYQSEAGGIYSMRVSSEKITTLTPATGLSSATDPAVEVKISKGRREAGIRPRGVTYSRIITTSDGDSIRRFVFFPCQTKAQQTAALGEPTVTYKGKIYSDPVAVAES